MSIDNPNFKALFDFSKQIKKDLTSNKRVRIAKVVVKYNWDDFEKDIETEIIISLDEQPHSVLNIVPKDWLTAESFYVRFLTGWEHWTFNSNTETLIIQRNEPSKLGSYYKVEFKEIS